MGLNESKLKEEKEEKQKDEVVTNGYNNSNLYCYSREDVTYPVKLKFYSVSEKEVLNKMNKEKDSQQKHVDGEITQVDGQVMLS